MRIGFGFDTHRLEEGEKLFLGGIPVPYIKGAAGHSDADVLIHSICDSLLGAAGLRDIGYHFPDTSDEYKNIESSILLKKCCGLIHEAGYEIANIDTTVVLQSPKISAYIPGMVNHLSEVMEIPSNRISVKAKTSEKLGFIGREEGVSAYAVVLLTEENSKL